MIVLVSGGAASGKSEYAESLLKNFSGEKIYLATMEVRDRESVRKVDRHRKMREGKGFLTEEHPTHIENAGIPKGSAVLLECLSNLTANECFGQEGIEGAEERVFRGIMAVSEKAALLVIVSNEIFADAILYDAYTRKYMEILASLNCRIAEKAEAVVEVINSMPVYWKGEAPCISGKPA